jgi:hypothetical protein
MKKIQQLFQKAVSENPRVLLDRETDWGVSKCFQSSLNDSSIPVLTRNTFRGAIPNGSVVRVVGMVQDIRDPELYGRVYEARYEGKEDITYVQTQYTENPRFNGIQVNVQRPKSLAERVPLVICPIPGQSSWTMPQQQQSSTLAHTPRSTGDMAKKRRRVDDDDDSHKEQAPKRRTAGDLNISPPAKDSSPSITSLPPIPGSVLVKVHVGKERVGFKLNDIVEFVGVLSVNPESSACSEFEEDEDNFRSSPLHLPCVHSIVSRTRLSSMSLPNTQLMFTSSARNDLKGMLMHRFGGDELAAEYAILHLVSRVHKRFTPTTPVGNLALCFSLHGSPWSTKPNSFVNMLSDILRSIRPASKLLSLSNEFIGKSSWIPRKDYDSNRLISGELQVSNGTMLFVDQTTLREGKIHGTAVSNLRSLQDLVTQQTIPVDFKFYSTTLPVDVPVISVCTTNSMLKDFCTVPLRPQSLPSSSSVSNYDIQNVRNYVEGVRWRIDLGVVAESSGISPVLERGLCEARKRGIKLEQSDAHRWLTTATLLAKSHGVKYLSKGHLEQSIKMDMARRARS